MCSGSFLFNACMDWLLGRASNLGAFIGGKRFTDLDFADDAVIFAESMDILVGALEQGVRVPGSTCVLDQDKIQAFNDFLDSAISSMSVCRENLKLVERFIYLGSDIHVSGSSSCEVERCLWQACRVRGHWTGVYGAADICARRRRSNSLEYWRFWSYFMVVRPGR
ncbi:hypothetical protein LDENG_00077680 [Lucifuga dentata]|nr:hypothetical protein LDENG_00077680 [Lucifuga dentata]